MALKARFGSLAFAAILTGLAGTALANDDTHGRSDAAPSDLPDASDITAPPAPESALDLIDPLPPIDEPQPLALPGRWSLIVAAGDNRAGNGAETKAFDNARATVAELFLINGFDQGHMRQLSAKPEDFREDGVKRASPFVLRRELAFVKNRTPDGCAFYMTSHGDEFGLTFGDDKLAPKAFWDMVDRLCQDQPTVAVISACYSGVFADPEWQRPNRFIMTAARRDRTSFGCGEDDDLPYFDACFLKASGTASSWADLADRTRACVITREAEEQLDPPSEPQVFIGEQIAPLMRGED